MVEDAGILRKLAAAYARIARSERNAERIKLHRAVNDLEPIRPVVLIHEIPWEEMNIDDELTLRCGDPYLRSIEQFMRRAIYQDKYMPADMIVQPYIPIQKVVHSTGIGISVDEETRASQEGRKIVSHKYADILQTEADLARLHAPVLTYDRAETERRYQLVGGILGDILPVKISGIPHFKVSTWDDIARYRGVTPLLTDLAQRPDFMHAIVQKLTDIQLSYLDQLEALDLFDTDPYYLHCTPIQTRDLPRSSYDGEQMTRQDVWGRGAAQIFGCVSKEMHEEFDIAYMRQTIGQCGLAYYGCCEPLDEKMDIVETIPNLRKVSMTPWADVHRGAEAIGRRYVLSAKPNPAAVAVPRLDSEGVKQELENILTACKRYNCACDIVLKDISTCSGRPENIFEWEQVAMDLVRSG